MATSPTKSLSIRLAGERLTNMRTHDDSRYLPTDCQPLGIKGTGPTLKLASSRMVKRIINHKGIESSCHQSA